MLDRTERQKALKALGFYKGEINGLWDALTKNAVKKFQEKYMPKSYWDGGKYTANVDRWIVSAERVKRIAPHFTVDEFECGCEGKYCNGMPAYLNEDLLRILEKTRTHYGKPMTITCGERCAKQNGTRQGSVNNSYHETGDAADFAILPLTNSVANRREIKSYLKKWRGFNFAYCYDPNSSNVREKAATYMGNAIHVQVDR